MARDLFSHISERRILSTFTKCLLLSYFLILAGCLGSAPGNYEVAPTPLNLPPLSIIPQNPQVIQGQTRRFSGQGGYIGTTGYKYSLVGLGGNVAPGSIDATTGIYTAPASVNANNAVAFVVVTDSLGQTASTTILNVVSMQITPTSQVVTVGKKANFDVIGGQAPFTWCVIDTITSTCLQNANVGDITSTGLFNAHTTSGTSTIMVTDSSGNTAQAVVVIQPQPQLSPSGTSVPYGWIMQMLTIGGSAPFTYAIDPTSAAAGGSISNSGLFVAPYLTGNTTLSVTDYFTYTSTATLSVISPNTMSSGDRSNCVLFPDTQGIKCWGSNLNNETGYSNALVYDGVIGHDYSLGNEANEIGARIPVHLLNSGSFINSKSVVSGSKHSCVLDTANNIRCWGTNSNGVFGTTVAVGSSLANASASVGGPGPVKYYNGGTCSGSSFSSTMIASGANHICAVDQSVAAGTRLYCWGKNSSAQLGIASTTDQSCPQNAAAYRLDFPSKILDIKAGADHTCVLLDKSGLATNTNQMRCWGSNVSGQLGIASLSAVGNSNSLLGDTPAEAAIIVSNTSSALPVVFTNPGPSLPAGGALMPVAIGVGSNHSCALLNDKTLRCWGDNTYGQLGRGSSTASFSTPDIVGMDLNNQTIIKFRAGYNKTCVILLGGLLECVGDATSGSLGIGSCANNIGTSPSQMGANLVNVNVDLSGYITDASIGLYHVCAILNDNRIKCWGEGLYGQLGNNSNSQLGCSSSQMGNNLPSVGFF